MHTTRTVSHVEERNYTDSVLSATISSLLGASATNPRTGAAVEIAAGYYGRAFAVAELVPGLNVFSASVQMAIARDLIRYGESVWCITINGGDISLTPVAGFDVRGNSPDPNQWVYRLDMAVPNGMLTRDALGSEILHFMYARDTSQPWLGLSPLNYASQTGKLAGLLESKLTDEAGGPVASLVPVPQGGDEQPDLKTDIEHAQGDALLLRTSAGGWGQGTGERPQSDWRPNRLGMNPPDSMVNLRGKIEQSVISACGVPQSIIAAGEGTSAREGWRHFLHGSLQPLGELIAEEISRKLETESSFSFDRLFASDISGRARAFQSLVGGGMEKERAARLAGFSEPAPA